MFRRIVIVLFGLIVCGGLAVLAVKVMGSSHDGTSATFDRAPLWLVTLVMFRAGIAEELFYRGYSIERFQAMGLGSLPPLPFLWSSLPLAITPEE